MADAQKAERTPPTKGSSISSPVPRLPVPLRAARVMNVQWSDHPYFAALDWAKDHHDVVVVDSRGGILLEFRFQHTASGWAEFAEKMQPFEGCPITLETSSGPAVDQLLQRHWNIHPVTPTAAKAYRQRKAPSGTKTDRCDAWSLADALRTDGHAWRILRPQDEATALIRLLCRDEIALIEQRTLLVNQLQAALHEYYLAATEAFDDWTHPSAWEFIVQFPTPAQLEKAGRRKWENFLHSRKLWRAQTRERRLVVFASAGALPASAPVTRAKSILAVSIAKTLLTLQQQIDHYRDAITAAFRVHPDHDIFGGLPGAKEVLAPRLLAEFGSVREEFPDADALCCQAGTSPVSYQSGQVNRCRVRRACNKVLRYTVHHWSDASRHTCRWAQAYYQRKRHEGHSHASALRALGKRWLRILWTMWQRRERYDEARHCRDIELGNSRHAC